MFRCAVQRTMDSERDGADIDRVSSAGAVWARIIASSFRGYRNGVDSSRREVDQTPLSVSPPRMGCIALHCIALRWMESPLCEMR